MPGCWETLLKPSSRIDLACVSTLTAPANDAASDSTAGCAVGFTGLYPLFFDPYVERELVDSLTGYLSVVLFPLLMLFCLFNFVVAAMMETFSVVQSESLEQVEDMERVIKEMRVRLHCQPVSAATSAAWHHAHPSATYETAQHMGTAIPLLMQACLESGKLMFAVAPATVNAAAMKRFERQMMGVPQQCWAPS